ncbi:hypothetical protein ACVWZ4_006160 [Bradyrhizobium sp. USDA 4472]
MPLTSAAAAAILAVQLGTPAAIQSEPPAIQNHAPIVQVGYCGNGYDIDIYGHCYPNGVIPPQYQAARRYGRHGRYGAYAGPVPCGNGADIDSRDGQCYPTGTVPPQFQQGRQGYYYGRQRRGYYDED